ncbi:MAG: VOC family protein [Pseudomonadota bacterium]|nr:VOC family protein [Pseudomonadota bacterium]
MPRLPTRIQPCLWFDTQAEEAARFDTGVFSGSRLGAVSHDPQTGRDQHGKPPSSAAWAR